MQYSVSYFVLLMSFIKLTKMFFKLKFLLLCEFSLTIITVVYTCSHTSVCVSVDETEIGNRGVMQVIEM